MSGDHCPECGKLDPGNDSFYCAECRAKQERLSENDLDFIMRGFAGDDSVWIAIHQLRVDLRTAQENWDRVANHLQHCALEKAALRADLKAAREGLLQAREEINGLDRELFRESEYSLKLQARIDNAPEYWVTCYQGVRSCLSHSKEAAWAEIEREVPPNIRHLYSVVPAQLLESEPPTPEQEK